MPAEPDETVSTPVPAASAPERLDERLPLEDQQEDLERTVALVEAEQGGALKVVGKAGIALAVVGVGVAGGVHFGVVAPAQEAFKDQPTRANYENAKAAMDTGNMGLAGGLALSATGGLLWFLFAN